MTLLLILSPLILTFIIVTGLNWLEFTDQDEDLLKACWGALIIAFVVILAVFEGTKYSKLYDSEILNGQILSKKMWDGPCVHSYPCHCHEDCEEEGSGKNEHEDCTEHCDTCYEHPFDRHWKADADVGSFEINTTDSQGLDEPQRWDIIQKGDPVAVSHTFINYVKAADMSLYHDETPASEQMLALLPDYPNNIYDYYNLDRVISIGVNQIDLKEWNHDLSLILRQLGPDKQANVIVVLVYSPDMAWATAVRSKWHGAKKNDIVLTIGVDNQNNILWDAVYSWSDKELFKVTLRDDIKDLGSINDVNKIMTTIQTDTNKLFQRKHMKDFEYLKHEIDPSSGVLMFLWIISGLVSFGVLGVFFFINLEEEGKI